MRMYNVLKQYEWRKKEQEIELEFLRELLGLNKDQYKLYADFKRSILESTQKELAEKADLTFEFNEIKYGRRVGAINFRIFSKTPIESLSDNEPINPPPLFPFIDAEISPSVDKLLLLVHLNRTELEKPYRRLWRRLRESRVLITLNAISCIATPRPTSLMPGF